MSLKKKKGELLTSVVAGDVRTIPARWLATLGVTTTTQESPLDILPDTIAGVKVESGVQQQRTDERNKKIVLIGDPTDVELHGVEYDRETGGLLPYVETIVPEGTAGLALQSDGTYADVQPLNSLWSLKTTRKATALTTRTWKTWEQIGGLPRVLEYFFLLPYYDKLEAPDGPNVRFVGTYFNLKDYNYQHEVTYVEQWQKDPWTDCAATQLKPEGIYWSTPFGSGNIPPCLHGEYTIDASTGTTHPTYAYAIVTQTFAATTPTTLSGEIVLEDQQMPHLGGWRRITKTITI